MKIIDVKAGDKYNGVLIVHVWHDEENAYFVLDCGIVFDLPLVCYNCNFTLGENREPMIGEMIELYNIKGEAPHVCTGEYIGKSKEGLFRIIGPNDRIIQGFNWKPFSPKKLIEVNEANLAKINIDYEVKG